MPSSYADMIPVSKAAKFLGISRQAVHYAIRNGLLQAERLSPRGVFIERAVLEEYKARRREKP